MAEFCRAAGLKQIHVARNVPIHEIVSDLAKYIEKLEYYKEDCKRNKTRS